MKLLLLLFCTAVLWSAPVRVSFDTSSLAAGNYFVDFQLNSGDAVTGNGNNTVTLNDFITGGGSLSVVQLDGSATGTVASGFSLVDTDLTGFNAVFLSLLPGTGFSFVLDYSTSYTTGFPDQFTFSILDSSFMSIVSVGNQALLTVDLFSGTTPSILASDAGVSVSIAAIPEPATWALMGGSLLALAITRRRSLRP